ncbi:protein NUCLEAR FUSION DEFECTIVE 6, chloroplastic/mitochondrial [Cocos nucifera]|uniref:Protein NUCLEAR FUSION DEFECTIVE 6, chloroplastic/mitochondrial n=1 Tax=Cocos nucifera TaxID=13894 RepID=A0A8K0ILI9_COCNU|nr:protein NUCLEAR FUSION DEFECTIVE 6, chloroplastic/mitochondrial [Cocos nucifera]
MASTSIRSINRIALSSLRSFAAKPKTAARYFAGASAATPPPTCRFSSFSRLPVELGCCGGSLFPLHSAVAAARLTSRLSLTSRSCRALSQGILCRTYPGL